MLLRVIGYVSFTAGSEEGSRAESQALRLNSTAGGGPCCGAWGSQPMTRQECPGLAFWPVWLGQAPLQTQSSHLYKKKVTRFSRGAVVPSPLQPCLFTMYGVETLSISLTAVVGHF